MPKIVKLESARELDGESWNVGEETDKKGLIVTEIKDYSQGFEQNMHVRYDIYANGKLYKSLVNMPVKLEYSVED